MKQFSNYHHLLRKPTPPSQWELASLAATIGGERINSENVKDFLTISLDVWNQTGELLTRESLTEAEQQACNSIEARMVDSDMLKGPLKIGNHLLPGVESFRVNDKGRASLEDIMVQAIGLKKPEDRLKWLKGFIKYWCHLDRRKGKDYLATGELLPKEEVPEVTHEEVADVISRYRTEGIGEPMDFMTRYRHWRLTMQTHKRECKESNHHDLRKCYEAGMKISEPLSSKPVRRKGNSQTSPR